MIYKTSDTTQILNWFRRLMVTTASRDRYVPITVDG